MPGINHGVFRKCEQFSSNTSDQGHVITTGKISPADAPSKKDISSENRDLTSGKPLQEHHMAGGMAGNVENLPLKACDFQYVSLGNQRVGRR